MNTLMTRPALRWTMHDTSLRTVHAWQVDVPGQAPGCLRVTLWAELLVTNVGPACRIWIIVTDETPDIISLTTHTCRAGASLHAKRPCAPGVGACLLHSVLSTLLPCLGLLLDALHLLEPIPVSSTQVHTSGAGPAHLQLQRCCARLDNTLRDSC